jgi:DNA-binding FrmR family transcriptional regulator
MGHRIKDRPRLIARIRRIQGQLNGVVRSLEQDETDCAKLLQTIAASRGALDGLMLKIFEEHIRMHILEPSGERPTSKQKRAMAEILDVAKAYMK